MNIIIHDGETVVESELFVEKNPNAMDDPTDHNELSLDGDESSVQLLEISLNGRTLTEGTDYVLRPGGMVVRSVPPAATIRTRVRIVPEDNTQLSGLYMSDGMYCTQCEVRGGNR
jgi:aminopeptidase N